ncbi:hypothetical protein MACJ_000684 [Theileria orientalis]|uniref:DNA-directed RNA polymerase I subunit RPA12 n=1 Tax=Theileria orientalis TaxID=68886 RepID=A0A976QRJ7_THEOR|nr:hypothetical protein MACJ_000684 [Theileria orientalis]
MDDLYEASERGDEIYISTLDPSVSEKMANINVNEAFDMVKYLYSENLMENRGLFVTDFKYKLADGLSAFDSSLKPESSIPLGYDYLVSVGCRTCGSSVDFKNNQLFFDFNNVRDNKLYPNKYLRCDTCNSIISPIFKKDESDSFFDNYTKDKNEDEDSQVYLYGTRCGYIFDESEKQWWKDSIHGSYSSTKLMQAKTANKSGKQTVKYNCEKCGHDIHLYSTFQARSADEGMSIMYECLKCKNRVVMAT